ncbi:hypothetical protein [Caballeronia telluris]|nr:hypothetical protein [Caballeronia telluris]
MGYGSTAQGCADNSIALGSNSIADRGSRIAPIRYR